MRQTAFLSTLVAIVGAGSCALAASGGGDAARTADVGAAKARTAHVSSVHYSFAIKMTNAHRPLVLRISGGASREAMSVRLRLSEMRLADGTTVPSTDGAIMLSKPFLYERAPGGVTMLGNVRWLRLPLVGVSDRSQLLSTVRSLTPSPLLRVIGEARLHPLAEDGAFAGPVAYDDPVVRTALHSLGGGIEFRRLRVTVQVGGDGLIHRVGITGRSPDGKTTLNLRARLYGFDRPVKVVPPEPGRFMDEQLEQLGA